MRAGMWPSVSLRWSCAFRLCPVVFPLALLPRRPLLPEPSPLQRPGHYGHRLPDGGEIAAARDHLVEQGDGPFGAGEIVGHAEWLGSGHGSAPSTTVGVAGPSPCFHCSSAIFTAIRVCKYKGAGPVTVSQ